MDNATHITNWLYQKNFDEKDFPKLISFITRKIWFVLVVPPSMDDAFTFFDSQNSRGKALEDYDLLKATHLRCIPEEIDDLTAIKCSQQWEVLDKKNILTYLLYNLWGRTRTLSRKDSTEVNIIREFKAIDSFSTSEFPLNNYLQPPLFSSWETDTIKGEVSYILKTNMQFNSNGSISILKDNLKWMPFQITKTIESGQPFFLFTQKYYSLYHQLFLIKNDERLFRRLHDLLSDFDNTGIGFLLEAFEASLIFYFDKFGYNRIDEVAMWLEHVLYYKRFEMYSLRYSTVNNHLLAVNPFDVIDQSSMPLHVIERMKQISERLYQKKNVLRFNVSRGVRKEYYKLFYQDAGFYKDKEIENFTSIYGAKKILMKLYANYD